MKVWRASFFVMAVGVMPLFFVKSLVPAMCIAGAVGFGVAGCLTTMDCIGAKIMDEDYQKHGVKIVFPGAAVLIAAIISLFLHFKDEPKND